MDKVSTLRKIALGKIKKLLSFLIAIQFSVFIILPENAIAAYQFDKVRFLLSTSNPIDILRLTNPEKDKIINLQMTVMQWSQENGKDIYKQTKDLIVAPPILKIPPGKTQLVRIGWRRPGSLSKELSYRLFIQDLTSYEAVQNTIRFKVQASMPVFIEPPSPLYQAQWQIKRIGSNQIKLTLNNTGNMHIQVGTLTITNANKQTIATINASAYVLPQETISTTLQTKIPIGNNATVTADTDNGKLIANIAVS